MDILTCNKCNQTKPENEFAPLFPRRISRTCKECQLAANRQYYKNTISNRKNRCDLPQITEKICPTCNTLKSIDNFHKEKDKLHGVRDNCKVCISNIMKKRRIILKENAKQNPIEPPHEKICQKCKIIKSIELFTKDEASKTGYINTCKSCHSDRVKKYAAIPENKEKIKEYRRKEENLQKQRERYKTDFHHHLRSLVRNRLTNYIRGKNKKECSTIEYLDCNIAFFKMWIEFQFDSFMSWENISSYWHLDHVIPCNSFDSSDNKQLKMCFHWTNIQPLEKIENLSKNNKIEQKYIQKLVKNLINFNEINTKFIGYQVLAETLKWLQVECRYGKNPIDVDEYISILSQSAIRNQAPNSVIDKDMEKAQRIDGSGSEESYQTPMKA